LLHFDQVIAWQHSISSSRRQVCCAHHCG
jgi:hypothetical protein